MPREGAILSIWPRLHSAVQLRDNERKGLDGDECFKGTSVDSFSAILQLRLSTIQVVFIIPHGLIVGSTSGEILRDPKFAILFTNDMNVMSVSTFSAII